VDQSRHSFWREWCMSCARHICMQVGCGHDGYLLRPSPHLSLVVDLVAEEPNVWKIVTEKTHSYQTRKE
jgi:hypothetical protein